MFNEIKWNCSTRLWDSKKITSQKICPQTWINIPFYITDRESEYFSLGRERGGILLWVGKIGDKNLDWDAADLCPHPVRGVYFGQFFTIMSKNIERRLSRYNASSDSTKLMVFKSSFSCSK